ncbi:uncharacterized protein N7482_002399 [Penicillium canariense]|uniref:Uncharacterized protein n=1 Tax=Penicillium canariense TaxID=189055 RepID=A0A9W9LV37_9EURO|nr:uncharacterized protein N7482_002399 [Penicillium canariense]KAJ5176522.1 hypothetical protein N7482_002399 [Penicillium canariense]
MWADSWIEGVRSGRQSIELEGGAGVAAVEELRVDEGIGRVVIARDEDGTVTFLMVLRSIGP